jgi:hypothetical protein
MDTRPRVWKETILNAKEMWKIGKDKSRNAYNLEGKKHGLNDTINKEMLERYSLEHDYPGEKERIEKMELEEPERLHNPFYQLNGEANHFNEVKFIFMT